MWMLFDSGQAEGEERKPIYDESAVGSKQIAEALLIAKRDNKLVLLQFGANRCIWCHRLHRFFETDKAVRRELRSDFVVVLVDVKDGHNGSVVGLYGQDAHSGIPAIAVLSSDGKPIASTDSEAFFENDHYSSKKIVKFLDSCIRN